MVKQYVREKVSQAILPFVGLAIEGAYENLLTLARGR